MGAIVIDEMEFIDVMKKLKIEVIGGVEVFKLYSTSDVNTPQNKIHVVQLKYKQA